jgi:hypothetical protein
MSNLKKCVVLVSNSNYLSRVLDTIQQIRIKGCYKDDIVIIRGSDWDEKTNSIFLNYCKTDNYPIFVKYYPEIDTKNILDVWKENPYETPFNCRVDKLFQLQKFYLFDTYFKKWEVILYIDGGFKVHRDINDVWHLQYKDHLIANDESQKNPHWKLHLQFHIDPKNKYCNSLLSDFNLDTKYFQTGFLLFDTNIINEKTVDELIKLMNKYPTAKTNDQAIMNLYFFKLRNIWKPLPEDKIYEYFYNPSLNLIFSKGS